MYRESGNFHVKNNCVKIFTVSFDLWKFFLTVDGYNVDERLESS